MAHLVTCIHDMHSLKWFVIQPYAYSLPVVCEIYFICIAACLVHLVAIVLMHWYFHNDFSWMETRIDAWLVFTRNFNRLKRDTKVTLRESIRKQCSRKFCFKIHNNDRMLTFTRRVISTHAKQLCIHRFCMN